MRMPSVHDAAFVVSASERERTRRGRASSRRRRPIRGQARAERASGTRVAGLLSVNEAMSLRSTMEVVWLKVIAEEISREVAEARARRRAAGAPEGPADAPAVAVEHGAEAARAADAPAAVEDRALGPAAAAAAAAAKIQQSLRSIRRPSRSFGRPRRTFARGLRSSTGQRAEACSGGHSDRSMSDDDLDGTRIAPAVVDELLPLVSLLPASVSTSPSARSGTSRSCCSSLGRIRPFQHSSGEPRTSRSAISAPI